MLSTLRADQRGFTLVTLMGVMLIVVSLVFVTYSAADGDLKPGKKDEQRKVAYAAAEAGIQNYLFHLTQNDDYWARCDTVPGPHAVNQRFPGAIPAAANRLKVPGSPASYIIELLPANGNAACVPGDTDSMIDTATGTFRIRATGLSRDAAPVKRSIIASFKRKSFLEYVYFTDYETSDPQTYKMLAVRGGVSGLETKEDPRPSPLLQRNIVGWAGEECGTKHWLEGRGAEQFEGHASNSAGIDQGGWQDFGPRNCTEIQFLGPNTATPGNDEPTGDDRDVVYGPLHTNDSLLICGHPRFGRGISDKIEVAGDPGWRAGGCASNAPNVNQPGGTAPNLGTWMKNSAPLQLPPSNVQLRTDAKPAFRFEGRTKIKLDNGHMYISGKREGDAAPIIDQHIPLPSSGALYVRHAAGCGSTYEPLKTYQGSDPNPNLTTGFGTGCGTVEVEGTYSVSLTIGAAGDIIVTENVLKAGGMGNVPDALLGLIADGFIRVYHPVKNRSVSGGGTNRCDNDGGPGGGPAQDMQIDAAMLTVGHSFIHDNYFCGATTGTLTVNGAIAQKYRGAVATSSGGIPQTGYRKDYKYDNRLKFRSPPHFINPLDAGWGVQLHTEQTPPK